MMMEHRNQSQPNLGPRPTVSPCRVSMKTCLRLLLAGLDCCGTREDHHVAAAAAEVNSASTLASESVGGRSVLRSRLPCGSRLIVDCIRLPLSFLLLLLHILIRLNNLSSRGGDSNKFFNTCLSTFLAKVLRTSFCVIAPKTKY